MQNIKRWLPFGILISITIFSFIFLVFSGGSDPYKPSTENPKVIYEEACAHCHGLDGMGDGFIYPAFEDEKLSLEEIKKSITDGSWRMPDFKFIRNDTLQNLALYIYKKGYRKQK